MEFKSFHFLNKRYLVHTQDSYQYEGQKTLIWHRKYFSFLLNSTDSHECAFLSKRLHHAHTLTHTNRQLDCMSVGSIFVGTRINARDAVHPSNNVRRIANVLRRRCASVSHAKVCTIAHLNTPNASAFNASNARSMHAERRRYADDTCECIGVHHQLKIDVIDNYIIGISGTSSARSPMRMQFELCEHCTYSTLGPRFCAGHR